MVDNVVTHVVDNMVTHAVDYMVDHNFKIKLIWLPNTELAHFFVCLHVCLLYIVDYMADHMVDYVVNHKKMCRPPK